MPADNDAKAAAAAEPRSAGQTEAERNGLAKKKPKAPSGVDLGGRSFADDEKKAMEERMQRGRDLLNGPRGQNTAHRMQQCASSCCCCSGCCSGCCGFSGAGAVFPEPPRRCAASTARSARRRSTPSSPRRWRSGTSPR